MISFGDFDGNLKSYLIYARALDTSSVLQVLSDRLADCTSLATAEEWARAFSSLTAREDAKSEHVDEVIDLIAREIASRGLASSLRPQATA